MKIRPVGAELIHADGRTDGQMDRHDEANSLCSQFCERAYKDEDVSINIIVLKTEESLISAAEHLDTLEKQGSSATTTGNASYL